MIILNYRQIYKEEISGAYLFYGYEKLLLRNTSEYIVKKYLKKDFRNINLLSLNGDQIELEDFINSVETLPVFDDKKVIIVKNVKNFSLKVDDSFYEILDKLADFVIVIFLDLEDELDKKRKFFKYFKKKNKNVEFPKLKGQEVIRFASQYFKLKGYEINNSDLSYFINKSSYNSRNIEVNLYDLKNEMDKLFSLSESPQIKREDIEASIIESIDTNIFRFLDCLSNRNVGQAILEYKNLHDLNEPAQKILFMISRQVRNLINYKSLLRSGYNSFEIQKRMAISPFEFNKICSFSNNFELEKLYELHAEILETDRALKTTSLSKDVLLELLIYKFA